MYRLHLYLTEEIKQQLSIKAKITGKTKAEIAREALEKGLMRTEALRSNSAKALLDLARIAESLPSEADSPRNLSTNHDYYAWGDKKNE